jgi:hypothetical protein
MIVLIVAALAFAASAETPPPAAPQAQNARPERQTCDRFGRVERADGAIQQGRAPQARRLDRLPAADLHLTVERTIGGCHIPVIVRQDIGGRR